MTNDIMLWLVDGPDWIKFAVERQLLEKNVIPTEALNCQEIEKIVSFLKNSEEGFSSILNTNASYKKESFWYLYFLSDIGLTSSELSFEEHFQNIFKLEDENSRFILSKEMKPDYFCISSIVLTSIVRMSPDYKEKLKSHIEVLLSKKRIDGGWHCATSRAVGKKLQDSESCPMDNLNILMLLSEYEEYRNNSELNGAIDLLLGHWNRRDEAWRLYGFGIGSQFKKLRYPESKYGILRVLDVLSNYPYALSSPEFEDMFEFVKEKGVNERYLPESVVMSFSDFDFGQKKVESRWLTFIIERIQMRINNLGS